MRKVFDGITERLEGFFSQRDSVALVVQCQDMNTVAILKILEGIDEGSSSEVFWTYCGNFVNSREYVSEVVKDFIAKHEGVRLGMDAAKMSPWPAIPKSILEESRSAVQRLRELLVFTRSLLPQPAGCSVLSVFSPLHFKDHPDSM